MPRLNEEVDEETHRALYHALLDDGLTFAEWMRRHIASSNRSAYLVP